MPNSETDERSLILVCNCFKINQKFQPVLPIVVRFIKKGDGEGKSETVNWFILNLVKKVGEREEGRKN